MNASGAPALSHREGTWMLVCVSCFAIGYSFVTAGNTVPGLYFGLLFKLNALNV